MLHLEKRPAMAAGGIVLLQLVRIAWLAHLPTGLLVQRIPDDAFYYLVLAKHFAAEGRWTFDGVAPSSGFHLLWGYLLAAGAWLTHGLGFHTVFVLCSLFATLLICGAVYLSAVAAERLFGRGASWGTFLVFSSAIVLVQGTWLMESPLLLFFGGACVAQLALARPSGWVFREGAACLLGALGSLSRSDFGLLPFFLVVAAFPAVDGERRRRIALLQLLGAALGVLVVFGHTYLVSGHVAQASAQVKLWWAHLQGHYSMPVLHLAENAFNPLFNLHELGAQPTRLDVVGYKVRQAVLLVLLLLAARFWWRGPRRFAAMLLPTLLCCCLGYGIVYRQDGGVQDWYIVSFVPAFALLAGAAATQIPRLFRAPAAMFVGLFAVVGLVLSVRPHAPWQEATYRAALEIKHHPEWNPVGSWNTGVMSYFSNGRVVNLDGLVNDDLLPYIRSGTLARYFLARHLSYIIESPNIFSGILAQRSGLADGAAAACLDRHQVLFPQDRFDSAYGMHLELQHLDLACLARADSRVSHD